VEQCYLYDLCYMTKCPYVPPSCSGRWAHRGPVLRPPCEYLALRHKAGHLKTDFKHALGTIAYHVPCHQRVQNMGTSIERIERCSGHDGT
jgi:hypothetical protein